jgi:hypothetical protein
VGASMICARREFVRFHILSSASLRQAPGSATGNRPLT